MERLKYLIKNFRCKQIGTEKRQRVRVTKPVSSFVIGQRFLKFLTSYLHTFIPSVFSLTLYSLLPTFAFLLFTFNFAHAGGYIYWAPDGVLVSANSGVAGLSDDMKGGALMFGAYAESIIVIRVDCNGNLPWGLQGRSIASYAGYQGNLMGVSDGKGGAIAVWCKDIPEKLYCQRVDSLGNRMWGADAQRVTLSDSAQWKPAIVSDGAKGMIIAWQERWGWQGSNFNYDIYAQRIDSSGMKCWGDYGVVVCNADSSQEHPAITVDNFGNSTIVWHDFRDGESDIFAQRLSNNGLSLWQINGIAVCDTGGTQNNAGVDAKVVVMATDTTIIVVWTDSRDGDYDILAQKLGIDGVPRWLPQGVVICDTIDIQGGGQIIPDGRGGAIFCWSDRRNGYWNIYSQRVSSNGDKLWLSQGIPICSTDSCIPWEYWRVLRIVSDGRSGAIICWQDNRSGNWDIYVQHIDSLGNILWDTNGMSVCTAANDQQYQEMIASDSNTAIICWTDWRSGSGRGYAQKVGDEPPVLLPDIWLSDTTYDFGDVVVGDSAFWPLVIKNFGLADLIIDSMILTDSVFSVVSPSFPDTIPAWGNDSMMVMVKFIPVDTGFVSEYLIVYSNDPDEESLSIRLMGNGILGIEEDKNLDLQNVVLFSVFPNPFKKNTTIKYNLPTQAEMKLKIYDISGRIVKTLINESRDSGAYKVFWNGTDSKGRLLPVGVYFYELDVINQKLIKKMILLK